MLSVGGGSAGLYRALLMKRGDAARMSKMPSR
jgi:hypothetical protein